ncbi:MAG: hypothetical protein ACI9Z4_000989 [Polaribacter sp.]|jgi:hypothetical protein
MGGMNMFGVGLSVGFSTLTEFHYIAKNDDDQIIKFFNLLGPSQKIF